MHSIPLVPSTVISMLTTLQKLKFCELRESVIFGQKPFFNTFTTLINLKKLVIQNICFFSNGVFYQIVFLIQNLKQLKFVGLPKIVSIDSYQLQIDYPHLQFRWYIQVYNDEPGEDRSDRSDRYLFKIKKDLYVMDYYEGEFNKVNEFEGKGIYSSMKSNGDRYEGDWKNGKKDGKGILYYKGRKRYDGEWKNGEKDGIGTYYFYDENDSLKATYEGEYKNDKMEGKGKVFSRGYCFVGEFKNDEKHGKGIVTQEVDNKFITLEGNFQNNKMNGKFLMTTNNGHNNVVFRNDKLLVKKKKKLESNLKVEEIEEKKEDEKNEEKEK
jgi:hypothetical protein